MRELLTAEEYSAELLELVVPDRGPAEELPLIAAAGRVLAQDVTSRVDVPGFANSAMDGYAVRFADVATVPVRLRVVGELAAGTDADPEARPGECVRIMTGAPLPGFADTVVAVEQTDGGTGTVEVRAVPSARGQHVRGAGEDVTAGDVVARAGDELGPGLLGALVATGANVVPVRRRPVVAVGVTGDELVTGPAPLRRGQLYESNSVVLAAALARDGAEPVRAEPLGDRPDALVDWLDASTDPATGVGLVLFTGGASVGSYDVVRDVLSEAGGTFRHVRMQPGKPQGWAVWRGIPVVSLPGNPLSASLSYELFVRPMLDRILGRRPPLWYTAVAAQGWRSPAGRRQLVPVRFTGDADGRLLAVPSHVRGSASHMVTSLAAADGFAMVPEEVTQVQPGDVLKVRWL